MSEILLCNQPLGGQALQNQCGISIDQLSALSCNISTSAAANTPYLIGDDHSVTGRGILGQLAPSHVAKELTNLSLSFGGDNVVALAEIKAKLNVTGYSQTDNIVKLSKHAKFLGNGLAVIDFGGRVGNVRNS